MDPDATLAMFRDRIETLRELVDTADLDSVPCAAEISEVVDLFTALDTWFTYKRGYLPRAWDRHLSKGGKTS